MNFSKSIFSISTVVGSMMFFLGNAQIQGTMQWPLKSAVGFTDFDFNSVGNQVDLDPAPIMVKDYFCNNHTYDGHRGTDLVGWPFYWYKMEKNFIEVIAAAPGLIVYKQDGNYDKICQTNNPDVPPGNLIKIQHSDLTVATYQHLKKGSLTSKKVGETVAAGEFLGIMGSSGNSSNPHLHFELEDKNQNIIDPFFFSSPANCNTTTSSTWWATGVQKSYYESNINALMTHYSPPSIGGFCPDLEKINIREEFNPLDPIYFGVYYKYINSNDVTSINVLKPDNTIWLAMSVVQPSTNWNYSYLSQQKTLPDVPGTWSFKATFGGKTYSKTFTVVRPGIKSIFSLTNLCPGNIISVQFTLTNLHPAYLKTFKLQLSDKFGSFSNPVTLATKSFANLNFTTPISGTIPTNTPPGTAYRVRIISTGANEFFADNKKDIIIGIGYNEIYPISQPDFINHQNCGSYDPPKLKGTIPAFGGSGNYSYLWEKSTNNINWSPIFMLPPSPPDYDPGVISQTTFYRRTVITNTCTSVSDPVKMEVFPPITNNNIIGPVTYSFCGSGPEQYLDGSKPSGGNGIYAYQWQKSSDNINWVPYAGNMEDYNPAVFNSPTVLSTTYYRRAVVSASCVTYSSPVIIYINPIPVISDIIVPGAGTLCPGQTISLGINAPVGSTYQWYKDGQLIPGATSNPFLANQTGYYVVNVILNGCGKLSNYVNIPSCKTNLLSTYNIEKEQRIQIFPNPSSGMLFIKNETCGEASAKIYDLKGRIVYERKYLSDNNELNLKNLPEGIYYVNISSGNKNYIYSIIIEK